MEVCNGRKGSLAHAEIIHNELYCPLCLMMDEKDNFEKEKNLEIKELNMEIDKLNKDE